VEAAEISNRRGIVSTVLFAESPVGEILRETYPELRDGTRDVTLGARILGGAGARPLLSPKRQDAARSALDFDHAANCDVSLYRMEEGNSVEEVAEHAHGNLFLILLRGVVVPPRKAFCGVHFALSWSGAVFQLSRGPSMASCKRLAAFISKVNGGLAVRKSGQLHGLTA
jgi:hypothetical protein